jgi:hypothetical protein
MYQQVRTLSQGHLVPLLPAVADHVAASYTPISTLSVNVTLNVYGRF